MKKTLFILFAVSLIGCKCIGQIPTQMAYVDENCIAKMPDVLKDLIVEDNCDIVSVIQIPASGINITPPLVGEVIASDGSGNLTKVYFQVVKMDTISPSITWNGPLAIAEGFDEAEKHYTQFLEWIKYDTNRIFYIPEFQAYLPDTTSSVVWYNSIVIQ